MKALWLPPLIIGTIETEPTSVRTHCVFHEWFFGSHLYAATPSGPGRVAPLTRLANVPDGNGNGASLAGKLLTTKACSPNTATDCSDCTVSMSGPMSTRRWSAMRGDAVPGRCVHPA